MNPYARPHMEKHITPGDFHRLAKATTYGYEHCNVCGYAFEKQPDGKLDMHDFRSHKRDCARAVRP